jgi:hypothetical protein
MESERARSMNDRPQRAYLPKLEQNTPLSGPINQRQRHAKEPCDHHTPLRSPTPDFFQVLTDAVPPTPHIHDLRAYIRSEKPAGRLASRRRPTMRCLLGKGGCVMLLVRVLCLPFSHPAGSARRWCLARCSRVRK